MARVFGIVTGGDPVVHDVETVGELKSAMKLSKYTARVNNAVVGDDHKLKENDVVDLATANKGGVQ